MNTLQMQLRRFAIFVTLLLSQTLNGLCATKSLRWMVSPGVNAGYNKLLEGYEGYKDLGNAGADIYIRPGRDTVLPDQWGDNFLFRISFDYFPLQTPDGVYGITEDIYAANFNLLYQFHRPQQEQDWVPFVGIGYGAYENRIELDTPATGKITGKKRYDGYVGSLGMFMPVFKFGAPFRLIPEIRYHAIEVLSTHTTNMTFQLGLCLWFSGERK